MAPVSYANVARKAAGTSEDNDSPNPSELQPQDNDCQQQIQAENAKPEKKKKKKRSRAMKKAAKAAAAAEAEGKSKASESSEAEEPPAVPVYVDAPPPKVNVWLKNKVTEQDIKKDEGQENEPSTLADASATTASSTAPSSTAPSVMKESTADNRPPKEPKEPPVAVLVKASSKPAPIIVSSGKTSAGSPWKTPAQSNAQVI